METTSKKASNKGCIIDIIIGSVILGIFLVAFGKKEENFYSYLFLIILAFVIILGVIRQILRHRKNNQQESKRIDWKTILAIIVVLGVIIFSKYLIPLISSNTASIILSLILAGFIVLFLTKNFKHYEPKKRKRILAFAVIIPLGIIIGLFANSSGNFGGPHQSEWDNSVDCVEKYLKHSLNDPGSYESIHWDKLVKQENGTYMVTHSFRAKNGFGGMNQETLTFVIGSDGSGRWTVLNAY